MNLLEKLNGQVARVYYEKGLTERDGILSNLNYFLRDIKKELKLDVLTLDDESFREKYEERFKDLSSETFHLYDIMDALMWIRDTCYEKYYDDIPVDTFLKIAYMETHAPNSLTTDRSKILSFGEVLTLNAETLGVIYPVLENYDMVYGCYGCGVVQDGKDELNGRCYISKPENEGNGVSSRYMLPIYCNNDVIRTVNEREEAEMER